MFVAKQSFPQIFLLLLLSASTGQVCAQSADFLGSGVSVPVSNMQTRSLGWMKAGKQEESNGQFWYTATPSRHGIQGLQPERWQISSRYAWRNGQAVALMAAKEPMPRLRSQVQLIYQTAPIGPGQIVLGVGTRKTGSTSLSRQGTGLTAGYDWGGLSLRMNYDPWINENNPNAWRFSVSTQF
jgi:hypothetical protein